MKNKDLSNAYKKNPINSFVVFIKTIAPFITLFSLIFTLVIYFRDHQKIQSDSLLLTALIFLFVISFSYGLIFLIKLFLNWIRNLNRIIFIPDRNSIPKEYNITSTLKFLEDELCDLCVISRTSFSFLCGDEKEYQAAKYDANAKKTYEANRKNLLESIVEAISNGSSIHFILMNPNITLDIPEFKMNKDKRNALIEHFDASIESFKELSNMLFGNDKSLVSLSIVENAITNSMLRLKVSNSIRRFHYDIGVEFLDNKPMIIFKNEKDIQQFNDRFESLIKSAIPFEEYENKRDQSLIQLKNIVEEYPLFSHTRNDKSILLGKELILSYKHFKYPNIYKHPAPASVQFLITNNCTTNCIMCKHYKLYNPKYELKYNEIIHVIDYLATIGTRSIIISGGEPLAHPKLLDILEHAYNRKLRIGLLTNGVKLDKSPISIIEANKIVEYCDWTQISLDSFDHVIYQKIRNVDALDVVLESIRNIISTLKKYHEKNPKSSRKIEVCFTIQKENITELMNFEETISKLSEFGIDKSMLRFKFAHGPCENGFNFICDDEEQIKNILSISLPSIGIEYLQNMIESKFYTINGISSGKPVRKKIYDFRDYNYTCQVLNFTCIIDAFGDVYPCCFLFDDNNSKSRIRAKYCLGSLRDRNIKMVTAYSVNNFSNIWTNSILIDRLRKVALPIDDEACQFCIRHCYQNEFLNTLNQNLVRNEKSLRIFELENEYEKVINYKFSENDFFWI